MIQLIWRNLTLERKPFLGSLLLRNSKHWAHFLIQWGRGLLPLAESAVLFHRPAMGLQGSRSTLRGIDVFQFHLWTALSCSILLGRLGREPTLNVSKKTSHCISKPRQWKTTITTMLVTKIGNNNLKWSFIVHCVPLCLEYETEFSTYSKAFYSEIFVNVWQCHHLFERKFAYFILVFFSRKQEIVVDVANRHTLRKLQ